MGLNLDPPAVSRHILSLTFATGRVRNFVAVFSSTFFLRSRILNPIVIRKLHAFIFEFSVSLLNTRENNYLLM